MEMFRTRQLVLDPPTEINAASSISARGCLRLSSIYLLVQHWSQSKVKHICAGATKTGPMGGIERAFARAGRGARRGHRASDVSPDLVARKWGNKKSPRRKWELVSPRRKNRSSEAGAKVLIERYSGARLRAPHPDAITGFDPPKIWNLRCSTKNPARWGGRGQSGVGARIAPWDNRINGLASRKLKLSRWNKLKVVGRALGGRFLNRSLQFLFGLMVEFLVPSFRFSSLLPKFISAAHNFNSSGPCHSSFLSLLRDGVARSNLHNLYASYGRWAMQL